MQHSWRNKTHSEVITFIKLATVLERQADKLPLFMPVAWIGGARLSKTVASLIKLLLENGFCFFSNCVRKKIIQLNLLMKHNLMTGFVFSWRKFSFWWYFCSTAANKWLQFKFYFTFIYLPLSYRCYFVVVCSWGLSRYFTHTWKNIHQFCW